MVGLAGKYVNWQMATKRTFINRSRWRLQIAFLTHRNVSTTRTWNSHVYGTWQAPGCRRQGVLFLFFSLVCLSLSYLLYITDILQVVYMLQTSSPCLCCLLPVDSDFPDIEVFIFTLFNLWFLSFVNSGAPSPTQRLQNDSNSSFHTLLTFKNVFL